MVEVLDAILEIFRVQDFANRYSNPLDQFLYAIFFPSVLLVAIIFLLSAKVFSGHSGIQILLGVSFYIFIIVYPPNASTSLYSFFAPISQLWFIVVIILGLMYYVLFMHSQGGGGGGRNPVPLASKMGDAYEIATGKSARNLDPRERSRLKQQLKVIEDQIKELKDEKNLATADEKRAYAERVAILEEKRKEIQHALKLV